MTNLTEVWAKHRKSGVRLVVAFSVDNVAATYSTRTFEMSLEEKLAVISKNNLWWDYSVFDPEDRVQSIFQFTDE